MAGETWSWSGKSPLGSLPLYETLITSHLHVHYCMFAMKQTWVWHNILPMPEYKELLWFEYPPSGNKWCLTSKHFSTDYSSKTATLGSTVKVKTLCFLCGMYQLNILQGLRVNETWIILLFSTRCIRSEGYGAWFVCMLRVYTLLITT